MGLLDLTPDQANSLLDFGNGLLSASGPSRMPVSLGQGFGQGMQAMRLGDQQRIQNQMQQAQMQLMPGQIEMQKMQLDAAKGSDARKKAFEQMLPTMPPEVQQAYMMAGSEKAFDMWRGSKMANMFTQGNAQGTPGGLSPSSAASFGAPELATTSASTTPSSMLSGTGITPQDVQLSFMSDPTGKTLVDKILSARVDSQKPVVNRGFGIGRMVNGNYVPDQASQDQALTLERGKQSITAPMESPVSIKLSGGQDAQLSRPEYAAFQQSGQLPARYQQGTPQSFPVVTPQEQAVRDRTAATLRQNEQTGTGPSWPNMAQLNAAGNRPQQSLGVPGLSQSQPDQINQARQTAAGKAVDENFAKDYVDFTAKGGSADAAKQLAQLHDVVLALGAKNPNLTGPFIGGTPDVVRRFTNPQSIAMRERVEEVAQRSLRAILGAQFTEKEGERLISRAYNQSQGEPENEIRVGRLSTQLQQAYDSKVDASNYFQQNGTLEGWKGRLSTMSDFNVDGGAPNQPASAQGGGKTATLSDISATARASGRSTAEVTAAMKARGYTIGGE